MVGAYICIFLIFMLTVVTGYFFYKYMVFRFMNGRVLDLYRRLSGTYKTFFVPLDQEVSLKYLQWVITRAKTKKSCVIMSALEEVKDKYGFNQEVSLMKIYKVEQGALQYNRMFFKDYDGALRDVPQKRKSLLSDVDLNKLLKAEREGKACVYGDHDFTIMDLCQTTQRLNNVDNQFGTEM